MPLHLVVCGMVFFLHKEVWPLPFVYSLCSSSKGNATYAGDQNSGILIDAGLSLRQLDQQLSLRGIALPAVKAIFITHEHSDHIKGLTAVSYTHLDVYKRQLLKSRIRQGFF